MQGMKRACEPLLSEYLADFPCVAIIGPRQCGKTTLAGSLPAAWRRFDLEKASDRDLVARDPELFLRLNPRQVVIDEAQLLPDLFPALRVAIDADRSATAAGFLALRSRGDIGQVHDYWLRGGYPEP